MKRDAIEQVPDALRTLFGNLKRYSSHQTVNFVSERQKMLSQVAAVLSSDSGDECFFTHVNLVKEFQSAAFVSFFPFPLGRGMRGRVSAVAEGFNEFGLRRLDAAFLRGPALMLNGKRCQASAVQIC